VEIHVIEWIVFLKAFVFNNQSLHDFPWLSRMTSMRIYTNNIWIVAIIVHVFELSQNGEHNIYRVRKGQWQNLKMQRV
jgi:hypothetical protein